MVEFSACGGIRNGGLLADVKAQKSSLSISKRTLEARESLVLKLQLGFSFELDHITNFDVTLEH